MCPAIHINSRSWLRSSSTHERQPEDLPLRRSLSKVVTARRCASRIAPRCARSHEGSVPHEVLYAKGIAGSIGSPHPPRPRHFCRTLRFLFPSPSAANLRCRFHPSASFPPPPELRRTTCLSRLRSRDAFPGVPRPHRGISLWSPHPPGDPPPSFVPSAAFLTPSTASSATSLAGLFHPAATSRFCPTGVCPSPRSRAGFRRPTHALLPLDAKAFDQPLRPRLQGFLSPR